MTVADIGIVFAMVASITGSAGTGAVYYMHQEFITGSSLLESELRQLKREHRKLLRIPEMMLTPDEAWYLDDLSNEIDDLKLELQN